MEVYSARDYFYKCINILSATIDDKYKLSPKQVDFLVECCVYNYEGGDLTNTSKLSKHMLDIKMFPRKGDTSIYKYEISIRKWFTSGRGIFTLPNNLNKKRGDTLDFSLHLKWKDEEVSS